VPLTGLTEMMDAQVDDPHRGLIDTRVETRIEEDTQPAGGIRPSGEHASNEICGTGFLLCPPRSTLVRCGFRTAPLFDSRRWQQWWQQ